MRKKVQLVIGDKVLIEDVNFLCEISHFFEAMLQGNFEESEMDSIELTDFIEPSEFVCFELILEELKRGKSDGEELFMTVFRIMSPKFFQTMSKIVVKVDDLPEIAMVTMKVEEVGEYLKIAAEFGNDLLAKNSLQKAVGVFSEFRKTLCFKQMSINEVKIVICHEYLDYKSETQILRAVFGWLNFDLAGREENFEEALSLVNWKKVTKNQLFFLAEKSRIVQKSEKLIDLVCAMYSIEWLLPKGKKNKIHYKGVWSYQSDMESVVPTKLQKKYPPEIMAAASNVLQSKEQSFNAAFFYDAQKEEFANNVIITPDFFRHVFDIYDFKIYLFGKVYEIDKNRAVRRRPINIHQQMWENMRNKKQDQCMETMHLCHRRDPYRVERLGRNFFISDRDHEPLQTFDCKDGSTKTLLLPNLEDIFLTQLPIWFFYPRPSRFERRTPITINKPTKSFENQPLPSKIKCHGLSSPFSDKFSTVLIESEHFSPNSDGTYQSATFLVSCRKVVYILFKNGPDSFGFYKSQGRYRGLEKLKDITCLEAKMEKLLAKHWPAESEKIDFTRSLMSFKIINPVWVDGVRLRKSKHSSAISDLLDLGNYFSKFPFPLHWKEELQEMSQHQENQTSDMEAELVGMLMEACQIN
ncbi:uncharacterized protein LOC132204480 isoform X2 [Neocloeon triangulifer]|uniref:uncharacterized protein LOC132204480 isoform X2 n=1 Tax=Neocloeon triangulifer TaxID=2078957 RepID=UPI00286F09E0|nr:uncharacterized protein LOC132204480 isoform X2 [Neocloeon triangulifer]